MELTLESALSPGAMVGHFAYLLLVISMLMRSITWLRIFVILSAIVALAYGAIWLHDPVTVFWEGMLIVVNVVQIFIIWYTNRRVQFNEDERRLIAERLNTLSPREARRLLDMGLWIDALPGTDLTEQGQPVHHLVYLLSGEVTIEVDGRTVGRCEPGNFVGEMSLVDGGPASATAKVAQEAYCWMIPTDRLRKLRREASPLMAALEVGIAHDLKRKILASNARPTGA
ncbi:Crp/Fnr family transcriptional regulator [Aestuariivita boseongensis]|uniref:Crp/Fnr family transcriptional regulator n=1 Tax=Aestuariivita boseongensis TaxID=1470562 RepID=UPI000681C174|nr:cyclic nucleotide-binding domain-containing protein [Aestuariivita boseongensis]